MNDQHNSRPRRMETVNEVGERIRRSKSWIHAAIQRNEFPAGIRLSSRCTRWDSFAVDRWIEEQFSKAEK
jgi:predicted DNA-binding transcriptional regulator AlpA